MSLKLSKLFRDFSNSVLRRSGISCPAFAIFSINPCASCAILALMLTSNSPGISLIVVSRKSVDLFIVLANLIISSFIGCPSKCFLASSTRLSIDSPILFNLVCSSVAVVSSFLLFSVNSLTVPPIPALILAAFF